MARRAPGTRMGGRARFTAAAAVAALLAGAAGRDAAAGHPVLCLGERAATVSTDPDAACAGPRVALPPDVGDKVVTIPLAPDAPAARGYVLSETRDPAGRLVRTAEILPRTPAPEPPPTLLPGDDLLDGPVRPFGREARVALVAVDGTTVVDCRPGTRPAGVLLGPYRMPRTGPVAVDVAAAGPPGFTAGIGDPGRSDAGPQQAGPVGDADPSRRLLLDAPGALREIVIACPEGGGTLRVRSVRAADAPGPPAPDRRAGWAWEAARWRDAPDALLADARRHGLTTLFVGLDIGASGIADADRLAAFVAAAGRAGIAVWAVEGDPEAVTPEGRAPFVARTRAIAAHQRAMPAAGRLAGIQYDIEPYLLPPDRLPGGWPAALARTLDDLAAAGDGLPVDVVVPFWLPSAGDGLAILAPALGRAAAITVMAYRTEPAAIVRVAAPMLDFGVERAIPVRVALEVLPLADEVRTTFLPAARGTLLHVSAAGRAAVVLLDREVEGPPGATFARAFEVVVPGSRTSFQGDAARMIALLPELRRRLAPWTSFGGLALHGIW